LKSIVVKPDSALQTFYRILMSKELRPFWTPDHPPAFDFDEIPKKFARNVRIIAKQLQQTECPGSKPAIMHRLAMCASILTTTEQTERCGMDLHK
jgi:hypothetical protein